MRDYSLDLQKIGLSDKEAKVYVAALEVGADTAQNISARANVNRATTYVAIKALTGLGFLSTFEKGKKQYFSALNPERLASLYDRGHAELEEKRLQIDRLIPELKQIHSASGEGSRVKYFEGKEALMAMVKEFYKEMKGGVILSISPIDLVREVFSKEDLDKLQAWRASKDIKVRGLYTYEKGALPEKNDLSAKRIDRDKFPLKSDISIYGNSVRIVTFGEKPSGIAIEDKNFADTLRSIFELAWEGAQSLRL